ncbi:MAG: hypothetical protein JO257_04045 [Deltaproteobacteria bacterium]|nr:hypothetical protein [Deltaproteobacteria bacterium]
MTELPRAELADHRPPPQVHLAIRHIFGGGTQVMAVALAIVIGVAIHLQHKRLTYSAHTTGQTVMHLQQRNGLRAYHLEVEYTDAAGSAHTGWIDTRGSLQATYPIDYDPAHPDHVRWHQPWYTDLVLMVVLLAFGSLALGGLAVAMFAGVQQLRRRNSIRGGFALHLLVLPAGCVALTVWLVELLRS